MTTAPAELSYGYVTGRFLLAIADGPDEGREPDVRAANQLTINFIPVQVVHRTTEDPATIVKLPVSASVNDDGYLEEEPGVLGMWLHVGFYDVKFTGQGAVPPFRIQVTAEHTEANPLDLTLVAPLTPSPVEKFVINEQVYTDTMTAIENMRGELIKSGPDQPAINGVLWVDTDDDDDGGSGGMGAIVGEGQPEGVVTATIGTEYIDTLATAGAVRWIKTTDVGSTGWKVTYGDTGWFYLPETVLVSPGLGMVGAAFGNDSIVVRRIGNVVSLRIYLYNSQTLTGTSPFRVNENNGLFELPLGFRPDANLEFMWPIHQYVSGEQRFELSYQKWNVSNYNGRVYATFLPETAYLLNVDFPTDSPWPTTIPGTAV